jgi:hypothetical protein
MRTPFAILLMIAPLFGVAQKVTPQVTNQAGFDLTASNLVITISIGEPAIATFSNNNLILTQGFLQPEIVPCGEYELTYYPNPTRDDMIVQALGCEIDIQSMQLIDPWGRVLTTMKPTIDNKVHLGDISPGVYFIRVFLTNANTETIKIAKVSN